MVFHYCHQNNFLLFIVLLSINGIFAQSAAAAALRNHRCTFLSPDFCNGKGTCYMDHNDRPRCACNYPYDGDYCEETSPCVGYCLNNGRCQVVDKEPECTCTSEWTGVNCWRRVPGGIVASAPCTLLGPDYCLNLGTCVSINNVERCRCQSGYSGSRCERLGELITTTTSTTTTSRIRRTCRDKPCRNNGTCYNTGSTYFCDCLRGYSGQDCEISMG